MGISGLHERVGHRGFAFGDEFINRLADAIINRRGLVIAQQFLDPFRGEALRVEMCIRDRSLSRNWAAAVQAGRNAA